MRNSPYRARQSPVISGRTGIEHPQEVLGVSIDELLNTGAAKKRAKRAGPVGRTQKLFEDVSKLPRRQQEKVAEVVSAMLDQYRRKAG